jgi:hypothetical protein
MPVDEDGAMYANDAVGMVAKEFGAKSNELMSLWGVFVFGIPVRQIARELGVSKSSMHRAKERAIDSFWTQYQSILLESREKAK